MTGLWHGPISPTIVHRIAVVATGGALVSIEPTAVHGIAAMAIGGSTDQEARRTHPVLMTVSRHSLGRSRSIS
jgi:hypothetical protein